MAKVTKKTSMQDIADYLGISKNAVSLALNGKEGVSDRLRAEIIAAAEELKYAGFTNDFDNSNKSIIIATANYITRENQFYYDIIWSIEKESRQKKINTIITNIEPHMEEKLELPAQLYKPDTIGVVLLGVMRKEYAMAIINSGMPVVIVDNYYNDIKCNSVVTANMEAAYDAVSYLIQMGHKKIGYIGAKNSTSSSYDRWAGYYKKMEECELAVDMDYCLTESKDVSYSQEEMVQFVNGLKKYPTAWFCSNDYIAVYLMTALRSKNIKVPGDISIVGFDDVQISSIVYPKLTTFKVKRDLISKKAIELLMESKPNDTAREKVKILTYADLVIRDSVLDLTKRQPGEL